MLKIMAKELNVPVICLSQLSRRWSIAIESRPPDTAHRTRPSSITGLQGLGGIAPVRGRIVRPFLETSRAEIDAYVARNGVPMPPRPWSPVPRRRWRRAVSALSSRW